MDPYTRRRAVSDQPAFARSGSGLRRAAFVVVLLAATVALPDRGAAASCGSGALQVSQACVNERGHITAYRCDGTNGALTCFCNSGGCLSAVTSACRATGGVLTDPFIGIPTCTWTGP